MKKKTTGETGSGPAVKYLRESEDKSDDAHAIGNQDELTGKLLADRGLALAACHGPGCPPGTFSDNDVSASKNRRRRGYEALLAAVERGDLDNGFIICYQLSRLWRSRQERAHAMELFAEHGVSVLAYRGLSADLSTSYGRMVCGIMGEVDVWEADVKGERQSDAQRAAVRSGLHPGGARPFAFELHPDPARKGHPDPAYRGRLIKPGVHKAEANALRHVAAELLKGRSLNSQVRYLNEKFTTTWGKPWTAVSLVRTLKRERNYGAIVFNGELFTQDNGYATGPFDDDLKDDPGPFSGTAWPALWSEQTQIRLAAVLDDPGRVTNTSRSNKLKSLLSHVATCGVCGQPAKSGTKGLKGQPRRHVYKCPGVKEHVSRSKPALDHIVTEWVLKRLEQMNRDQRHALLAGPDHSGPFMDRLRELRVKQDKLVKTFLDGTTPEGLYRSHMASLKAQIAAAEKAVAAHSAAPVVADLLLAANVRAAWEALPIDRQRAILKEMVTVVIHPAEPGRTLKPGVEWTAENACITVSWNMEEDGTPLLFGHFEPLPGELERDDGFIS